jgi:hypothetical protein
MRAAVITEEQIKALEFGLNLAHKYLPVSNALAILQSLSLVEPVAWQYRPSDLLSVAFSTTNPERIEAVKSFGDTYIIEGLYPMVLA